MSDHDRTILSRSALIDEMAGTLGGRVAEQLTVGEPGSGGGADLQQANQLARRMVCELGMTEKLDALAYAGFAVSEDTARTIEVEVRRLLDEATGRARDVLTAHRHVLETAAAALVDQDSLTLRELQAILDGTPAPGQPAATPRPGRVVGPPAR